MHEGAPLYIEDAQLISRCMDGDGEAQRGLYGRHGPRVRAFFARTGFEAADADDLAQETFLRVFASLHTFDISRGTLGGWLSTIAKNVARKQWRKRPAPEDYDPQLAQQTLAASIDEAARAESREELSAVEECVKLLPGDLGIIIRQRYVEGLTTRGIAQAADLPESTVRLRLAQAKEMLAKCLENKGITE